MIWCIVSILFYRKHYETVRLESNGIRAGDEIFPVTGWLSSGEGTLAFCE